MASEKTHGARRSWTALEDNDPTGFWPKAGLAAKKAARIRTLEIPKRSPALDLRDYALWTEVNRRMRLQGQKMPESKRESRA